MKIEAILAEPQNYLSKIVELEGYFTVIKEGNDYIAYLSSSADVPEAEKQQIRIAQPFAELKAIIRPLPSMQLIYRGNLTNPPYYYSFPIRLSARVEMNGINLVVLQEITALSLKVPYTGKLGEISKQSDYDYSAKIDYAPQLTPENKQAAKAKVSSRRVMQLKESRENILVLSLEENRYARRLLNQILSIEGWLYYLRSTKAGEHHLVLRTDAIRASIVGLGPLKELSSIWIPPSDIYKLLRAHLPLHPENEDAYHLSITGKIDYYQEESPLLYNETQPKLFFTEIQAITIFEEAYLLET